MQLDSAPRYWNYIVVGFASLFIFIAHGPHGYKLEPDGCVSLKRMDRMGANWSQMGAFQEKALLL
jgi:hypothetical protein